jgi:hypothetical protein
MALPSFLSGVNLSGNDSGFFVPPGREVKIFQGESSIFSSTSFPNAKLIYDDDIQLNIKSKYGTLVESAGNNFLTLLSGANIFGQTISGQFAIQGFQIWQETDPLTFNLAINLYMNTSALNDVVKPSLYIASLIVPSTTTDKGKNSWNLIPPGPNLSALLEKMGLGSTATDLENKGVLKQSTGVFNIKIGDYLSIPDVIITGAEPVFSKVLVEDESGKLAPISCKMGLEFSTASVATKEMLQKLYSAL